MAMGFGVACVLIGRLELQLSWVWTVVPSNAVIYTRFFFPTESYVEEERKYLISDSRACWMAHAVALSKKRERERKAIFFCPLKNQRKPCKIFVTNSVPLSSKPYNPAVSLPQWTGKCQPVVWRVRSLQGQHLTEGWQVTAHGFHSASCPGPFSPQASKDLSA